MARNPRSRSAKLRIRDPHRIARRCDVTRETKLGVGIAGLFLTVVGTGVAWKWYRGETPAVEGNETAAAAAEACGAPFGGLALNKNRRSPPPPAALMSLTTETVESAEPQSRRRCRS